MTDLPRVGLDQVVMASKEHDQPALAVNVATGQSVEQSGNKTIQTVSRSLSQHQQKP